MLAMFSAFDGGEFSSKTLGVLYLRATRLHGRELIWESSSGCGLSEKRLVNLPYHCCEMAGKVRGSVMSPYGQVTYSIREDIHSKLRHITRTSCVPGLA
ncbi:hypothetical protein BD311DRAFT_753139 [Dichomitus squalens]|uniref:Uncharacterized protein n=1 Tax=Dichomitus squalens TaxID=114155 RepID=A0A4Q9MT52_9APHY|nr:hypothetical protein BD311DRAFT_753139 [Dichomitus squalens]